MWGHFKFRRKEKACKSKFLVVLFSDNWRRNILINIVDCIVYSLLGKFDFSSQLKQPIKHYNSSGVLDFWTYYFTDFLLFFLWFNHHWILSWLPVDNLNVRIFIISIDYFTTVRRRFHTAGPWLLSTVSFCWVSWWCDFAYVELIDRRCQLVFVQKFWIVVVFGMIREWLSVQKFTGNVMSNVLLNFFSGWDFTFLLEKFELFHVTSLTECELIFVLFKSIKLELELIGEREVFLIATDVVIGNV